MFSRARALLYNSGGELELALRLFGPGIYNRSRVVGEGIERFQHETDRLEMALPAQLRGMRFVLYLGRRDRTKDTDLLARAFAQFKTAKPKSGLQLVLAGPGSESFASTEGVHDLGLVSNEIKSALLTHCGALAQPSHHESFSRALMEAWSVGRPVLAQGDCLATAGAVKDSGGGWLATNESEWAQLFARIADAAETIDKRAMIYCHKDPVMVIDASIIGTLGIGAAAIDENAVADIAGRSVAVLRLDRYGGVFIITVTQLIGAGEHGRLHKDICAPTAEQEFPIRVEP